MRFVVGNRYVLRGDVWRLVKIRTTDPKLYARDGTLLKLLELRCGRAKLVLLGDGTPNGNPRDKLSIAGEVSLRRLARAGVRAAR